MNWSRKDVRETLGGKEREGGKLAQDVVLYFPASSIGSPGGARCGICMMFVSGHCTVVAGEIDGQHGVCGLYVHGKHEGPGMHGTMPKSQVGYITQAPTHCGSCEYFESPHRCQIVRGRVEAQGCCNAWEKDD